MKVILAGFNLDASVIDEARAAGVAAEKLTPEVLSAAYARISRNPAPVNELRAQALTEVEKARQSNRKIIFGMGHHSVAEHAVFNFDILGISRLAIEYLEHFRLCSFTEKSQRYITLDNDFVMPGELAGTPFEPRLRNLIADQARIYEQLHRTIFARLQQRHADLVATRAGSVLVDGWAKEDARYATLLCTSGQLGFTANARNLELIIKRLNAAPLEEVRDLAKQFYDAAVAVAPSILLFTQPSPFDVETRSDLSSLARCALPAQTDGPTASDASLIHCTPDADRRVAAALLHCASSLSMSTCLQTVTAMDDAALRKVFETAFARMEFYDAPPREFEHIQLTFEVQISAAAYGQLKRHRMMSQSAQSYLPSLGLTVPPAVEEAGLADAFRAHGEVAAALFADILAQQPDAAPYALTNAHRRRVVVTTNLRDLYHFCRLREDAHAQWDIRRLAAVMREQAQRAMPLSTLLLCGKDSYVERYCALFGRRPAMDPAAPAAE